MDLGSKEKKYALAAALAAVALLVMFKQTRGIVLLPYVFFLPGFSLSYILFNKDTIDKVERIFISCLLSLTVIPLVVFNSSLLGIRINQTNVLITSTLITLIALAIKFARTYKSKQKQI